MAELIKTTDSLNDGRLKLNAAITDSETALKTANTAKETAELAKAESENTQTQLDTIVIEGDSSVEAAQARVNNSGTAFPTLKQRLDAEHQEVTAQLQQNENNIKTTETEVSNLSSRIGELGASTTFKGSETNANILAKTGMTIGDEWFDTTNNQSLRWNGTVWTNVGGTIKLGNKSVTPEKTVMYETGKNMFDKTRIKKGGYTQFTDGAFIGLEGYNTTDYFIPVISGKQYIQTRGEQYAVFDNNYQPIGGAGGGLAVDIPAMGAFVKVNVKDEFLDTYQLEIGNTQTAYEPFRYVLKKQYVNKDENIHTVGRKNAKYGAVKQAISDLILSPNETVIDVYTGEFEEVVDNLRGPSNLTIRGQGKEATRIVDKSGDYYQSPVQIVGDFTMKDLAIVANNDNVETLPDLTSYAYHGDYVGAGTSVFENVRFESYQNSAVGIGTHGNQTMIFRNCEIYTDSDYGAALYFHCAVLNGSEKPNQRLIFDNCRIHAKKGYALNMEDSNILYGDGLGTDFEVTFINCHFWSDELGIACINGAPAATGPNMIVGNIALSPKSYGNNLVELNA
ncbi:hypothetical protein [Jeotgalibaca porci]|uniref:hypothetical protein n=1 Tax=Jeotgalibaca porci TaxID=1868793 RepID=UPI0035A14EEF